MNTFEKRDYWIFEFDFSHSTENHLNADSNWSFEHNNRTKRFTGSTSLKGLISYQIMNTLQADNHPHSIFHISYVPLAVYSMHTILSTNGRYTGAWLIAEYSMVFVTFTKISDLFESRKSFPDKENVMDVQFLG